MPDGRFAPSPTGDLHLGNLRTAALAWLFARSTGARFLVRMEDLDTASVRDRYYASQLDDLAALGLEWDGEVVRQSERVDAYRHAIAALERGGFTYPCFCSRREILEAAAAPHGPGVPDGAYPGTCRHLTATERTARAEATGRPPSLRVHGEGNRIAFVDRQCGPVDGMVDDFVIQRFDGTPAYNLAVVVDDAAQGIGEVVRGDDLLTTTPRQIFLASLLGLSVPRYAHVPLVLGPGGERLAKRDGAVTLADRRARGETPAAVLGWLLHHAGATDGDDPVDAGGLAALAATFDPARLRREAWVLSPADLGER